MDDQFWHEKWENNELAFHQGEFNPVLLRYWRGLDIPAGARVFVPLCGKSLDMLWLAQQGYDVLGVELSEIAAQSFFDENGMTATRQQAGQFTAYRSDRVQILCGDFFMLTPELLHGVTAVYDRASLIALPGEMRLQYVDKLKSLLRPAVKTLLITLNYEYGQINPPPFRVFDDEVGGLFQPWCELEYLEAPDTVVKGITCPQSAFSLQVK